MRANRIVSVIVATGVLGAGVMFWLSGDLPAGAGPTSADEVFSPSERHVKPVRSKQELQRVSAGSPRIEAGNNQEASGTTSPQKSMSKAEVLNHPKSWMLAHSEKDVAWLNRAGFPTMDQEAALEAATDDQLKAMGHMRARTHLAMRAAKIALNAGNTEAIEPAYRQLANQLIAGGPYEATKIIELGHEMLAMAKSGLNENQSKGLQRLMQAYSMANVVSLAHGDEGQKNAIFNNTAALRRYAPNVDLDVPASTGFFALSNLNRDRANLGLPPYNAEPRPIIHIKDNTTIYLR
jgi:hypothetical protein